MKTRIVSCILLVSCLVVLVVVKKAEAADDWITITSSHYDSHCGDDGSNTVEGALDGTGDWVHEVNENHELILNLGATYNVKKVRGRSLAGPDDPTDADIYVSANKTSWGAAVGSGIDWSDSSVWVETDTTDKNGRYVKIIINDTEDASRDLVWGVSPFATIFDVYGEIVVTTTAAQVIFIIED